MTYRVVFAADSGTLGYEPYVTSPSGTPSSGITAGLLKDIFPGATGGATNFVGHAHNGFIYFQATDDVHGVELWRPNGTAAGTTLVADVDFGPANSFPDHFTSVGTTLYFQANTAANGIELWKSNGTAAGTTLVRDINPGAGSSGAYHLTALGNRLIFRADDGVNGNEIWVSDGTEFGTTVLKDINPGAGSSNVLLGPGGVLGNQLFFLADDGTNGQELWVTNGTEGGTALVKDIYTGGTSSNLYMNTVAGGNLFFTAEDGTHGRELWVSNGTNAGTTMVVDLNVGAGDGISTGNQQIVRLGNSNQVVFAADNGTLGTELWMSDGTAAGTSLVKDIIPGAGSSGVSELTAVGGLVFFRANSVDHGSELWVTDGTEAGTVRVTDIAPGGASSTPYIMGVLDVNGAPTAPSLSANTVAENANNGTVVGALSATDPDGNPLAFSLTSNPGGKFAISGSNLVVAGAIDFETATSHTVTVQVSDGLGGTVSRNFTINVTNLPDPTAGDDTLNGTAGADTINGLAGNDRINGLGGPDRLNGGTGRDDLRGGKGNDDLTGGDGLDFLQGGDGDDELNGGKGADRLVGGKGDDTFYGGKGDDEMTGDAGGDRFVFAGAFGRDRITDFRVGADIIDLSGRGLNFRRLDVDSVGGGDDTRITIGANRITLLDFDAGDLRANMFDF